MHLFDELINPTANSREDEAAGPEQTTGPDIRRATAALRLSEASGTARRSRSRLQTVCPRKRRHPPLRWPKRTAAGSLRSTPTDWKVSKDELQAFNHENLLGSLMQYLRRHQEADAIWESDQQMDADVDDGRSSEQSTREKLPSIGDTVPSHQTAQMQPFTFGAWTHRLGEGIQIASMPYRSLCNCYNSLPRGCTLRRRISLCIGPTSPAPWDICQVYGQASTWSMIITSTAGRPRSPNWRPTHIRRDSKPPALSGNPHQAALSLTEMSPYGPRTSTQSSDRPPESGAPTQEARSIRGSQEGKQSGRSRLSPTATGKPHSVGPGTGGQILLGRNPLA